MTSGFGKRFSIPSSIIACAPSAVSSPGWNTGISVPLHASRCCASSVAAPASHATCMSCPQACITGVGCPSASSALTLLA
jgi:hypothetical protein